MGIRFKTSEYRQWSRRQFMVRAVEAMTREGKIPPPVRKRIRESFHRLAIEDARLARLFA